MQRLEMAALGLLPRTGWLLTITSSLPSVHPGFVHQGRINCCLNVSRALGDAQFKQDGFRPASEQQVSPEPDIREAVINTTSDFLVRTG